MRIVIKMITGNVAIMELAGVAAEALALAPDHLDTIVRAEIDKWSADDRSKVLSWRAMPTEAVPVDSYFFDAWRDETPELVIDFDMDKCREIHKNTLRTLRVSKLKALDVDYLLADERGDVEEKRNIAKKKQALRDVTNDPGINAATTPEELKAFIPDILK